MKEIPGYPKYFADEYGIIHSARRGKLRPLRPILNSHGYHEVHISMFPGSPFRRVGVHFLVLLAFKGERPAGTETRHLDGIRTNNIPSNLEWGTRLEQAADRVVHGTSGAGVTRALSLPDIDEVRHLYELGFTQAVIADHFKVSPSCISSVIVKKKKNTGERNGMSAAKRAARGENHVEG